MKYTHLYSKVISSRVVEIDFYLKTYKFLKDDVQLDIVM